MFKYNRTTNDWDDVIFSAKNGQNQLMSLSLDCYKKASRDIVYYVEFKIGKRGRNNYLEQTGKDGLASLLWAKKILKEFIEELKEEKKYSPHTTKTIIIQWDDKKRRDVYVRGLKDIGFKYNMIYGYRALYIKI